MRPLDDARARAAAPDGAQDLAVLRDVRHRGRRLAAAGQLSGRASDAAAARPPHVADQHRHEPAVDAGRARPRLSLDRRRSSSGSIATLTTLEGLERYHGHFLNWYDTSTLAPLHPRYVSTVDSGNLAGGAASRSRRGCSALDRRAADAPTAARRARRHRRPPRRGVLAASTGPRTRDAR